MSEGASSAIRNWLSVRSQATGISVGADPELTAFLSVLARTGGARSCLQVGGDASAVVDLCAALQPVRSRSTEEGVDLPGFSGWWFGEDVEIARVAAARAESLQVRGFRAILGPPFQILAEFTENIDLLVLAGPSPKARRWLDAALPRVARGGSVVATAVFAGGRALDLDAEDLESRALRGFPAYFLGHPQLASTIVPIADGLAVGGKLASLVTER